VVSSSAGLVAMRKVLLAAVVLSLPTAAAAQYGEGPYGTGNNGWCRSQPGTSCPTGRQARQAGPPNLAPTLPGVGSAAPPAVATIVPPLMLGLRQLLEGGAQGIPLNPPAGPSIPPNATAQGFAPGGRHPRVPAQAFQLVPGRYYVYPVLPGGETAAANGWAEISRVGASSGYEVRGSSSTYRIRPSRPSNGWFGSGHLYLITEYLQAPQNPLNVRARPSWMPMARPTPVTFVRRATGNLEYDVYYYDVGRTRLGPRETWAYMGQ
jgi:hypothetical protein